MTVLRNADHVRMVGEALKEFPLRTERYEVAAVRVGDHVRMEGKVLKDTLKEPALGMDDVEGEALEKLTERRELAALRNGRTLKDILL